MHMVHPAPPAWNPVGHDPDAFEVWLQIELQHLYDGALGEPLPEELVRLVGHDREG